MFRVVLVFFFDIVGVMFCFCRVVEVVDVWFWRLCTGCGVWVFRVGWVCVAVCGCCVYGVGGRLWWLMCVCADVCVMCLFVAVCV